MKYIHAHITLGISESPIEFQRGSVIYVPFVKKTGQPWQV